MAFPNQVLSCRNCKNNQNLKLETNEAGTFIVCRSCGCRTWLSQPKDEEKSLYFSRYTTGVNELRNLRFDLAAESFREAYGMDPDEPDALWGLVCAEYGIVQVMSYHDQKYSPVFCLVNYRERASFARNMHVLMLRELINRGCKDHDIFDAWLRDVEKQIQKILEATPESHAWKWDVFIACKISETTETAPDAVGKTPEHEEALRLYEELTGRGLRVFYSEKYFVDNMGKPDSDWQIMSALLNSRQMLLVCGGERNDEKLNTPWVRSEWMRWRSMQKQGVKRDDSLIVYSISESTRSLPEGLFTGNTVYPSRRAELLQTLERNCYTDTQYDRDLRKGQELLSRSDFSEASRVFTHTAHMRPDRAEPHVYLFLCDLRVTRLSGLSEKHIESSPESNPHYREAETRNNRAFCELFHDLNDRIRFLRDRQKDDKMAKMQEQMEEMKRQLQEKMKEPEHQPQEKMKEPERQPQEKMKEPERQPQEKTKETPILIPVQDFRYSQGLEFEKLADGTYAVKGRGTCKDTELVIPPMTPEGGRVTAIGERAFCECDSLTSVTIPDSVTAIEDSAFIRCSSLTSVTIPNNMTTIGGGAFHGCSNLNSITIPSSVTEIGLWTFGDCSNVIIFCEHPSKPSDWADDWNPDNLPVVWNYKPEGATSATKTSTETVRYSQGLWFEKLADGMYAVTGIGTCTDTELVIPPMTPEGGRVTAIGEDAFCGCRSLTSVTIPDSVTAIGEGAFGWCSNLTSVTLPDSLTTIEGRAFGCCDSLTSVIIPNSVTTIGKIAFCGCDSLTSVNLPQSVENLGWNPFVCCGNLRTITVDPSNGKYYCQDNCVIDKESRKLVVGLQTSRIPDGVTTIGALAFECINLTSITIPDSVTIIEESAFQLCGSLTSITIPNSVTTIGQEAFSGCSGLTSIAIPNSVTTIGQEAFSGCSGLTSIAIPNSVTTIGQEAFSRCSGLTSIAIPDSVTEIGKGAFQYCPNVTIYCAHPSKPSNWADDWNPDNCPVVWNYKPEGATSATKTPTETVRYSQGLWFEKLADGTYAVVEDFGTCKDTELVIPPMTPGGGRVTAIGERAFCNRSNLTSVTIPDSVTAIEYGAFYGCSSLTSVTIPDRVTTIGSSAFEGCTGLTSFTIPNRVTVIKGGAFRGCSSLTSVTIPDSVTTIGSIAFTRCRGLTSITIPDSVTTIGEYAFSDCSNLTSVTIPDSVTAMGQGVFNACPNVTINCAHPSKPSGWNDDWNPDNRPVVWKNKLKSLFSRLRSN